MPETYFDVISNDLNPKKLLLNKGDKLFLQGDELKITSNKLVFNISVASRKIKGKKDWKNIGTISLDASVVSKSCDHRLHFHHPRWRTDLVH